MLKGSRTEGIRLCARRRDQGLCPSGAVRAGGWEMALFGTCRMDDAMRFATELKVGTVNMWEVPGYYCCNGLVYLGVGISAVQS